MFKKLVCQWVNKVTQYCTEGSVIRQYSYEWVRHPAGHPVHPQTTHQCSHCPNSTQSPKCKSASYNLWRGPHNDISKH